MADRPCHRLRLSAVFWKGTNEPLHHGSLIGYNCEFCSVSRSVRCSSGKLPRSPVVNKNVIPCVCEPPFSLYLLENLCRFKASHRDDSPGGYFGYFVSKCLTSEHSSEKAAPPPQILGTFPTEVIHLQTGGLDVILWCCPSLQLQEARTDRGKCCSSSLHLSCSFLKVPGLLRICFCT